MRPSWNNAPPRHRVCSSSGYSSQASSRETLRVNGRAVISTAAGLRESMAERGKPPASVLVITVEELFFHCGKALIRSELWNPNRHVPAGTIPTIGRMVAEQLGGIDPDKAEADTLTAIIQEMLLTTTSERQGRVIDHDATASMEKKKQEGYF